MCYIWFSSAQGSSYFLSIKTWCLSFYLRHFELLSFLNEFLRLIYYAINELLELSSRKKLFMFIYLANQPSSHSDLGSSIKWAKLKHNNVFGNKLMSMRFFFLSLMSMRVDLSIYITLYVLNVYIYKNILKKLEIWIVLICK